MMQTMRPGLDSYVHFTPLHPHTTMFPLLDGLLASKMDKYNRTRWDHWKNAYPAQTSLFTKATPHCF